MTLNPCKSCERSKYCNMESEDVIGCANYQERVPHTKADEIRAMTDRELADFLCDNTSCGHCIASELCWSGHNGFEYWIKQEVQE